MGYIYQIHCDLPEIQNTYIGKTTRTVEERFKEHIMDAMNGVRNFKLHNAIRKYGKEHFYFTILGEYPDNELNEKEIYWIDYYNTYYNGWNSTLGGDGNVIWTQEMKQQQSQIMKNYYSKNPISEKTKQAISKKALERWADNNYKEKLSQAQKMSYKNNPKRVETQRQNNLKRYEDPNEREKSRQAQLKRWSDPEEHIKASKAHIKSQGKKIKCIETGIVYDCIADACEACGKSRRATGISSYLKGDKKSAFGYHWELVGDE